MAERKMRAEINFSKSHNSGLQMGENMGTVNATMNTTNTFAAGATVYLGGSSPQSPEDQFLDALMAGDTSLGVPIEPPEPGTCLWILTELRSWREGPPDRPLWISGSSGCGKSVMSLFILREKQKWISSQEEANGKIIVAGSFCDRHPNRQTPIWILRTLLYEILRQNRDLIDTKDPEFWQESKNQGQLILNLDAFESIDSLAKLLKQITNQANVSDVYLVVDGQYQQQQDAMDLERLFELVSKQCGEKDPRWIFSTRPNDLDRLMQNAQVIDQFKKNRGDIRVVAQARMKYLQRLNSAINESFINEVVDIITTRAEGMFLWLSLALKSLGNGTLWDINEVKDKLQKIPYDVQAIYGNIYEHLDKKMRNLLLWVYAAGRSLTMSEVLVMWALQDGANSTEEIEKKSLSPNTIRNSFEGNLKALLTLHDDNSIHFAHPSVKDFTQQLCTNSDKGQGREQLSIAKTHKQLAELCLAYLSLEKIQNLDVPEPPVDEHGMIDRAEREKKVEKYLGEYQFLEYSITFLGLHLRESEKDDHEQVDIKTRDDFFSEKSRAMQHWVKGYDLLVRCTADTGSTSSLSLLFISARLNLTSLAERFISTGNALASLLNLPGVKMLAGNMVRSQLVDLPDIKGWRALHIAADSEAEKVVEWLLNNGAAVDSETIGLVRPGRTALHFAASKTSPAALRIVQTLLNAGANPGEPTMFGGNTPLHYAVQGGSLEILAALLNHKYDRKYADPNYANYSGFTPLHKAVAIPGGEAIVELLLQNNANPSKPSSLDKVAVARGVKDVTVASTIRAVSIMNPGNMWKSATDAFHGVATNKSALHIAVGVKGTEETVKTLLKWYSDQGEMVNNKDSLGYTALHSAVNGDSCSTHVKLLLDSKRVDVDGQDETGKTALVLYMRKLGKSHSPSDNRDLKASKQVLDDLLEAGAAAGIPDNEGKRAIDYARQAGLTWAVEKLSSVLELPVSPEPAPEPQSEPTQGVRGMLKKTGLGKLSKMF
ncbi:hypothetical protein MKX08_009056 [Trichoderma sp. CBMAI-0020]|nr:hypothetical protein MKX08_009056 [Trichoderma sp. CBMAI-0020]